MSSADAAPTPAAALAATAAAAASAPTASPLPEMPDDARFSVMSVVWLSVFLALAVGLFCANVYTAVATRRLAASSGAGKRASPVRNRLNLLLVFGSGMNMLNQIYFLVMDVGRGLPCSAIVTTGGVLYSSMVLSVTSVLVHRSTTLLPASQRRVVRAALFALILAGFSTIAASNALRKWNEDLIAVGVCSAIWNRTLNTVGKACLVVLYLVVLVVFVRPLYAHMRAVRRFSGGLRADDPSAHRLEAMVHTLFIKITLAIIAIVASTVLGILNLFGRYITIEFSIQNLAMVYASTLALERFGTRRSSSAGAGGDTSDSATLLETVSSEARRGGGSTPYLIPKRPAGPTPSSDRMRQASASVHHVSSTAVDLFDDSCGGGDSDADDGLPGGAAGVKRVTPSPSPKPAPMPLRLLPRDEPMPPLPQFAMPMVPMQVQADTLPYHHHPASAAAPLASLAPESEATVSAGMRRVGSGVWIGEPELDVSGDPEGEDMGEPRLADYSDHAYEPSSLGPYVNAAAAVRRSASRGGGDTKNPRGRPQ
ncbi:hypothetical protein H9P43_004220 [Blastocladiella emersonii ATCC 22665]|nr:hypothetical protein H9P43_004220 [Blastocladiella emersonii ATCC 22665]